MKYPLISVVIPTKNSASTLANCLRSIRAQGYPNYEVLVVDAFSSDRTEEVARSFDARFISSPAGLPAARNLGFSKAKGSIFVSIDSDQMLESGLFSEIATLMGSHDALIIPQVGHGTDFISRCKDLEQRCYLGDDTTESARVFSRDAFTTVGGYDPQLYFGEDRDMYSRIKARFKVGRTVAMVMHDTRQFSIVHDLGKAYVYGKTLRRYIAKDHPQTRRWLSTTNFFFLRHAKMLLGEPLEATGLLVIKLAEYCAGAVGVIASFAERADGGKG
jgi:glycosyltransferase involved in cell wall biosynthesis